MSVVSESADTEFVMDSRREDLLPGPKTFWLISFCCSSPLCRLNAFGVVVVVGFASNAKCDGEGEK